MIDLERLVSSENVKGNYGPWFRFLWNPALESDIRKSRQAEMFSREKPNFINRIKLTTINKIVLISMLDTQNFIFFVWPFQIWIIKWIWIKPNQRIWIKLFKGCLLSKRKTWSTNKVIAIIHKWSDNFQTSQMRECFNIIFRGQGKQGFWRRYPSSWFYWLFGV